MLEKIVNDYNNWLKIGENMSRRPVSYFQGSGEYSGYLRTKAWYEIQIANYIDLENAQDSVKLVESKVNYY